MTSTPALFHKGAVPNSLVRSALFTTKSLGEDRGMVKNRRICSQSNYEIFYTGEELNQFDSQALYAILQAQRDSGMEIGSEVLITQASLIQMLGLEANGNTYRRIYGQLQRLTTCTLKIKHTVGGSAREYHGHIIDRFWKDDKGHICFTLNPDLASMFDADCSFVSLKRKVSVEKLLSKWLLDYTTSHSYFIPMKVSDIKELSGNINATGQFTRQLKDACDEISEKLGSSAPFVRYEIEKGMLKLYKQKIQQQIGVPSPKQNKEKEDKFDGWN